MVGQPKFTISASERPAVEARFWAKVVPRANGCLIWTSTIDRYGYGTISVHGRKVGAHRVAYELVHGPIPKGLAVDHLCCTRPCVNHDHMELVTPPENTRRGVQRRPLAKCGHPFDRTIKEATGMRRECSKCRREYMWVYNRNRPERAKAT